MLNELTKVEILAIISVGLALRSIVSLHSYSGAEKQPMFGDYEAQRHWQEITVNLNATQWYKNGTNNDLLYWGLDYPPLTAYHSLLLGQVAKVIDPSYVALHHSRGYESLDHKHFMRMTVLFGDLFIYIPSVLILCFSIQHLIKMNIMLPLFLIFMLYPGQILIDNGHFQYNNVSLGLASLAIAAVLYSRNNVAAFFFTLSLNYKQMELYHSLPFFFLMLSTCMSKKSFKSKMFSILSLALIVSMTFVVIWIPWVSSYDDLISVIQRLFPFGRGVFEDKVSNFWCALNIIYKLKQHYTNESMAKICLAITALLAIPVNIFLFWKCNKKNFLFAMFNTASVFFMFSYQVHEKSILLVALPACCLFFYMPNEVIWFLEVSTFSMLPLLIKDNLVYAFFALMTIFHLTFKCLNIEEISKSKSNLPVPFKKILSTFINLTLVIMLVLSIAALIIPPPVRYPDIWPLIISVCSFGQFLLLFLMGLIQISGYSKDEVLSLLKTNCNDKLKVN